MRDLPKESWLPLKAAQDHLGGLFAFHGYQALETPVLEPTELFLRKSSGELAARMYTFTDPGGNQVSLRPEYTASIVRHYLEEGTPLSIPPYQGGIERGQEGVADRLPVRFQYAGPVFRYEGDALIPSPSPNPPPSPLGKRGSRGVVEGRVEGPAYRQFIQVGAELLGSFNPRADAEILSLSCMALSSLGLSGHRLELGDVGVFYRLLESLGLSERAILFILSSIAELKSGEEGLARVQERAEQLRLLTPTPASGHSSQSAITKRDPPLSPLGKGGQRGVGREAGGEGYQNYLSAAIRNMEVGEARQLLHGLLEWAEVGSLGQREPSEVVERLLRKFRGTDDPASLQRGLEMAYRLARVRGEPEGCLTEVEKLIESCGLNPSVLDRLKEVMGLLDVDHLYGAKVVLDFGLARGLAYYTGIVFEIRHPGLETSLGGGGRYDGLARALGSPSNLPALGFAYTLEHLLDALALEGKVQEGGDGPNRVLVLAPNGEAYREALRLARELRGEGTPVEMEVCGMSLEESLSYARAKGIIEVIAVDSGGKRTTYRVSP